MNPRITFDSENSFNKTIDFAIEVAQDDEVKLIGVGKEAVGGDGKASQFTLQYIAESVDLSFSWMEQDIRDKVFFWMENYALGGDSFRYYPDQTDTTRYLVCKLDGNNKTFDPQRAHPAVVLFKARLKVRVIDISAQVATDRLAFYP